MAWQWGNIIIPKSTKCNTISYKIIEGFYLFVFVVFSFTDLPLFKFLSANGFKILLLFLQEKQMNKVREKLDRCNKEKLLEFCDFLDITLNKSTIKKVCWFSITDFLVVDEI
jgi:hypothetical protein